MSSNQNARIISDLKYMLELMETGKHQIRSPQAENLILRDLYFATKRIKGEFGIMGGKKK
jgi:hypothetical protein